MPSNLRTALVVAVTLMLVTSAGVAGAAYGTATSADMHDASVEAADEIFVFENGDAVLVYRGEHEDTATSGHAALDVSKGLAAVFLTGATDPELSGQATIDIDPDMFDAQGAVAMPTPESLTDLTLDVSTSTDETESSGSLVVDATFMSDAETTGELPTTSTDEILATEGVVTIGSSLTMQGYVFMGTLPEMAEENAEMPAEADEPEAEAFEGDVYELTLTEVDDGFVLFGYQSIIVNEFATDSWETSEAAEETLLNTFSGVGEMLDGETTVTVDEHEFDAETGRLTMAYTVNFDGVEEALSEHLADAMADSQDVELTEEQRELVAERISAATLTEMTVIMEQTESTTVFAWNVKLDGIDELVTANLDIATLAGKDEALVETHRAKLDAKQAADLTMTLNWRGLLSSVDADEPTNRLQLEAGFDHENWESFVTELDARDIDVPTSSVQITAGTEEGVLSTDMAVTVSQSGLVDMVLAEAMKQGATDDMDPHSAKILEAMQQGDLEKAKLMVNMQEGTVTIQAAAKFADLTKLGELVDEQFDGLHVQKLYSELEAGETTTYVKVTGATMANPTIDQVQLLPEVSVDTVVHMPGDWDPATTVFPEIDETQVGAFLELEEAAPDQEPMGAGEEQPEPIAAGVSGTAIGVGAVALLGAALLARRVRG
ncbi:hypothetical protein [Haloarchaeobius sp. HME9146]|uniref:hypothetical protein n=1 Tax=Haloarchaeobius sp. HME9146 TaxID=2978732 RepID=UPI0021BFE574|nr:hypothetical protein [Haloarchaeobius sp. HME9146]MCT9097761.1 hypothetical protein [Haloarchaeobius sp. HME9146]